MGWQTTNTIAGINRSSNSWWAPPANQSGGSAALSIANADLAYWATVYGYDEPDLMVMDNTRYANFKQAFQTTTRFIDNMQDKEALQQGFRYHFLFNNCVVLADRNCLANVAYIMNSKYLFPVFHEADYFTIDPWVKPSNQRVLVEHLLDVAACEPLAAHEHQDHEY